MSGFIEYIKSIIEFLRDVNMDRKKVSWPTWKDTRAATIVVVVAVLISAVFLGVVDAAFAYLIKGVLS